MNPNVVMNDQEKSDLQTQVNEIVNKVLGEDVSKEEAIKKISVEVAALAPEKELGGMGEETGIGDMKNMAEDEE